MNVYRFGLRKEFAPFNIGYVALMITRVSKKSLFGETSIPYAISQFPQSYTFL